MRALLKLTNSFVFIKLYQNLVTAHAFKDHVLKHCGASALPGDWQGLGTHGLFAVGLFKPKPVGLIIVLGWQNAGSVIRVCSSQDCQALENY